MGAKQDKDTVEELAANWEVGTAFEEVTSNLTDYFSEVADQIEPLVEKAAIALEDYHAKFAAELTAELVKRQELDVCQMAESDTDGEVVGFLIEVFHRDGKFGVPTECFDTTGKSLSDLLENWASDAGPLYRKNGAIYLHKLADQIAGGKNADN